MRDHPALDRRLAEALTRFVRCAQSPRFRASRKAFFDIRLPPSTPNFPIVDVDAYFVLWTLCAEPFVYTRLGWRAASPLLENPPHGL